LDRSLGRLKVAAALRDAGATIEIHDDLFPSDAPDELWLKAAGEKGWVVLTKDKNIRFHSREKMALVSHDVQAFVLTAGALNGDEMAGIFVGALEKIAKVLNKNKSGFVATISRGGAIRIVWPASHRL
jgi:predicted nuclease of predicted toxin-antitoxin system